MHRHQYEPIPHLTLASLEAGLLRPKIQEAAAAMAASKVDPASFDWMQHSPNIIDRLIHGELTLILARQAKP